MPKHAPSSAFGDRQSGDLPAIFMGRYKLIGEAWASDAEQEEGKKPPSHVVYHSRRASGTSAPISS